jgi:uncharacterized protein YqeY
MSLKERINQDIKSAMLAKEKDKLTALRAIKAMILLAETDKGATGELTDVQEFAILSKASKQRKESAEIFAQQNREDLASKELLELEVISTYLPEMLSEAAIETNIKAIIAKVGATSLQDLGKVMGLAVKEMQGKADGKIINETVKKLLS